MKTLRNILSFFSPVPLSGWLLGGLAAVLLEHFLGDTVSYHLYLPKIPVLFGADIVLKSPELIPSVLGYDLLIYVLPMLLVARLAAPIANRLAVWLEHLPVWAAALLHLAAFYGILHLWAGISDYRALVVKLTYWLN